MSSRGRTPRSDERCRSDKCASTKSPSEGTAFSSLASIVSSTDPIGLVYDAAPSEFPAGLKIDADDKMVARVLGDSAIRLWGLTPAERLLRQLRAERIRVVRD